MGNKLRFYKLTWWINTDLISIFFLIFFRPNVCKTREEDVEDDGESESKEGNSTDKEEEDSIIQAFHLNLETCAEKSNKYQCTKMWVIVEFCHTRNFLIFSSCLIFLSYLIRLTFNRLLFILPLCLFYFPFFTVPHKAAKNVHTKSPTNVAVDLGVDDLPKTRMVIVWNWIWLRLRTRLKHWVARNLCAVRKKGLFRKKWLIWRYLRPLMSLLVIFRRRCLRIIWSLFH